MSLGLLGSRVPEIVIVLLREGLKLTPIGRPLTDGFVAPSNKLKTIGSIASPSHLIWLTEPVVEFDNVIRGPGLTTIVPLLLPGPHTPPLALMLYM